MDIVFITLFPEEVKRFFIKGIFQSAANSGLFRPQFVNLRDFSSSPHHKVDEYPYGGKRGMVLRADILKGAIESIPNYQSYDIIYTCPKGPIFTQLHAMQLVKKRGIIIISGYYEGVDERIFDLFNIQRISIGNIIVSSGDVAACVIAEAVVRLIPNVVGKMDSVLDDSIISGLLEYPQYTAPRKIDGKNVPNVVLSGHHQKILDWKRKQSLKTTLFLKPSLLKSATLSQDDKQQLKTILME